MTKNNEPASELDDSRFDNITIAGMRDRLNNLVTEDERTRFMNYIIALMEAQAAIIENELIVQRCKEDLAPLLRWRNRS
jgi:hypothetical protein